MYVGLTTEEAFRVATINNNKQKHIPLTFQDKVKLGRKLIAEGSDENGKLSSCLKEALGRLEMKDSKDSLSTIVSVSRYSDECYDLFLRIVDIFEAKEGSETSLPQKLFRMLQADHVQTRLAALREAIDTSIAKACRWLEEEKKKKALKRIFV